jgi:DNA primase
LARIKDSSVEEVRAAADIVEVISARTPLRKAGSRFTGRCPFHEERTPSFSVDAVKKVYYCFGCGAGGDLIKFVQETENVDFAGAIEWLADRFRVPLEYEEVSPQVDAARKRRERALQLLEAAAAFYERYLWETEAAAPARDYLAGRGFWPDACRDFRLGFAPGGQMLARKALEKGFTREELVAAGLVNRRANDYFSGRIVFPLADARGRVLGFQARKLRDDPLPAKYVNSPESELFQKGAVLYGLDRARAAIAKQERAIVVEGNTDVIALHQAGLEPVVASMGTALTERQLKALSGLTSRLWLCFDGDAAGEAATLRGMELAAQQGFAVRVVKLAEGSDPADLASGFEALLDGAESYLVHRVRLELDRATDRGEAFTHVQEVLSRFEDSPDRQDAVRLAADRLDLPRETQAGLAARTHQAATGRVTVKMLEAGDRLELDALAGAARYPRVRLLLAELTPEHFDGELHRALSRRIAEGEDFDSPELVSLRAQLEARVEAEAIDEVTAEELLFRLRARGIERELARSGDDLARTKELQAALQRVREAIGSLA